MPSVATCIEDHFPPRLWPVRQKVDEGTEREAGQVDRIYLKMVQETVERSQFLTAERTFAEYQSKLAEVRRYEDGWDSYDAPAPNERAITQAKQILEQLRQANLTPDAVEASAEGGIGICFMDGDKYAHFECFNDGEITGVVYQGQNEPVVWEAQSADITDSIERIRDYFS